MTRWVSGLGLCAGVCTLASGCAPEEPPSHPLLATWELDGEPVPFEQFLIAEGPEHCDWQQAIFLSTGVPPGQTMRSRNQHQYLRDPEGVLPPEYSAGLDLDADLPAAASSTGLTNEAGIQLWLTGDGAIAYLVYEPGTVEAWPRAEAPLGCD